MSKRLYTQKPLYRIARQYVAGRAQASLIVVLLFTTTGYTQQNLDQLLKDAKKAAAKAKAQHPGQKKEEQGLPAGYDNSWKMNVSINTILQSKMDLVSTSDSKEKIKGSAAIQFHASFSSNQNIATLDGNEFQLGAYADWDDDYKKYAQPPEGSYTFSWQGNQTRTYSNGSEAYDYSGTGNAPAALMSVSFDFNKKTKAGWLEIGVWNDEDNYKLQAVGKVKSCQDDKCNTIDAKDLSLAWGGLFGVLRECQLYSRSMNNNMANKITNNPSQVWGMNVGEATFTETKEGYTITYSNSKTLDSVQEGYRGTDKTIATTNVQVTFTQGNPPEYEAVIEQDKTIPGFGKTDYQDWIPEGPGVADQSASSQAPEINKDKGNSIAFDIHIIDKKTGKDVTVLHPFTVTYTLDKVSQYKGFCMNYPVKDKADDKPDLRWDTLARAESALKSYKENTLVSKPEEGDKLIAFIASYDYAAYGILKAHVHLDDDNLDLEAHLKDHPDSPFVTIPKDDNKNKIADKWETDNEIYSKNYKDVWDDEEQAGNSNNGDGFTLYEEYRGIRAKGIHKRLSPRSKDIIIVNTCGHTLDKAIAFFKTATDGAIIPLQVTANDGIDINDPIVNKNAPNGKEQHAVVLKSIASDNDSSFDEVLGEVFTKPGKDISIDNLKSHRPHESVAASPKDVNYLGISDNISDESTFDYTFAHELAHCLGVQHHGNSKVYFFSSFDHYLFSDTSFRYMDENGKRIFINEPVTFAKKLSDEGAFAAEPGSQASGDVFCIMCYNQDFQYSFPSGSVKKILIRCNTNHSNGTHFCTNKTGTERNKPDKKPFSVFGDSQTGGNCTSQFRVKDL